MTQVQIREKAIVVHRELGISHRDLMRGLSVALAGRVHFVNGDRINVTDLGREIEIGVGAERERRVGRLGFPVTQLEFHFVGFCASEITAFLHIFLRAYTKGGG